MGCSSGGDSTCIGKKRCCHLARDTMKLKSKKMAMNGHEQNANQEAWLPVNVPRRHIADNNDFT